MSNIKEIRPEDDEFGTRLMALLAEYGIGTFLFSGLNGENAGISSMNFESTQKGATALALLVRAVPELFMILEEAKLNAYVTMITTALQMGSPVERDGKVSDDDLLKNFTVSGKLKN